MMIARERHQRQYLRDLELHRLVAHGDRRAVMDRERKIRKELGE